MPRPGLGRILLGLTGIGFALVGAWGILTHQANSPPLPILRWWIGLVILHDAIIAPVTALIGWSVSRWLPAGARAPVQFAAIVGGLVTVFSLPLLWRQGHGFEGSTLMTRNYRANLEGLLATVAVLTAVVSVARKRSHPRSGRRATRPPEPQRDEPA